MDAIDLFSLAPINSDHSDVISSDLLSYDFLSCDFLKQCASASTRLPGIVLEGQWLTDNGWFLICTTENCPYEEALHFTLLDSNLKVLDSIELSAPYSPGIATSFTVKHSGQLSFSMGGDASFTLYVKAEGISLLKKLSDKGKRKKSFQKSYLSIEEVN